LPLLPNAKSHSCGAEAKGTKTDGLPRRTVAQGEQTSRTSMRNIIKGPCNPEKMGMSNVPWSKPLNGLMAIHQQYGY